MYFFYLSRLLYSLYPSRTQGLSQPSPILDPKANGVEVSIDAAVPHVEMPHDAGDQVGRTVAPGGREADLGHLGDAGVALGRETGLREEVVVRDGGDGHAQGEQGQRGDGAGPVLALGAVQEGRGRRFGTR